MYKKKNLKKKIQLRCAKHIAINVLDTKTTTKTTTTTTTISSEHYIS